MILLIIKNDPDTLNQGRNQFGPFIRLLSLFIDVHSFEKIIVHCMELR